MKNKKDETNRRDVLLKVVRANLTGPGKGVESWDKNDKLNFLSEILEVIPCLNGWVVGLREQGIIYDQSQNTAILSIQLKLKLS